MPRSKLSLSSQVLGFVDRSTFHRIVNQYGADKHSKGSNNWTHFVSKLFMQLAGATSLRDISNELRSATGNLNHLCVLRASCKSSLSYMNRHRTFELFRDFYFALLDIFEPSLQRLRLYTRRLKRKIFIMYASIIPLILSIFIKLNFNN